MAKHVLNGSAATVLLFAAAMGWAQTGPSLMPAPTPPSPRTAPRTPEPSPPPVAAASDLKITLMDGSIVAGKISVPELTVETAFGVLKVPFEQILSFTPGLNNHPELDQKIGGLVNDLNSESFPEREQAQQTLYKMGPELTPELQRHLKTAETEKQLRLQKLIEDFESMREDEDADRSHDWQREDVIATRGFTIVGRITTPGFAVGSPYGTLQLKLSDIHFAHRGTAEPEEIRKTFTVSGNVMTTHTFEDPQIRLRRGDQVTLTATGSISLPPWGNNARTGPEGSGNYGTMQPGNIPTGALVGRVAGGELFKVGEKYTFVAAKPGVIDFTIAVPGDYGGTQFPGQYDVKIVIKRKP